jgi:hypothetical protein
MDSIYIPNGNKSSGEEIPAHHPSLIMQDNQTDTTHHLSCGCCGGACIRDKAWWNKNKNASLRPPMPSTLSSSSISTTPGSSGSVSEYEGY